MIHQIFEFLADSVCFSVEFSNFGVKRLKIFADFTHPASTRGKFRHKVTFQSKNSSNSRQRFPLTKRINYIQYFRCVSKRFCNYFCNFISILLGLARRVRSHEFIFRNITFIYDHGVFRSLNGDAVGVNDTVCIQVKLLRVGPIGKERFKPLVFLSPVGQFRIIDCHCKAEAIV
ncbi:hypothetical protein SDC9_178756 [bioreactor metagenome]|uniref:Uncharacterized protein n=1 Tax=bioreactor metagenome TaxID=1076179 RepID=A0A645GYZ0_9ZZZZ